MRSFLFVSLFVSVFVLPAAAHAAVPADPVAVRQQLVDAIAAGNVAKAMALFADDAVVDGGLECTEQPCTDRKAIEKDIRKRIEYRNRATPLANYVSGNVLTTRVALKSDVISDFGFERAIVWVIYEFRNGRIVHERASYDRSDDQTRRFVATLQEFIRTSREGVPIEPGK